MTVAVPLEQQCPGRDVNLLGDAGEQVAVSRAAPFAQVGVRVPAVGRNQSRPMRGDVELVQIGHQAIVRADDMPHPVRGIGDNRLALAVGLNELSLPPGEHGLAIEHLDVEVQLVVRGRIRPEPDQLAAGVEDHRAPVSRA